MELQIDSRDIRVTVQDIISVQDDTNTQVIEFVFAKELLDYDLWTLNAFAVYKVAGAEGARFEICTKVVTETELKVQWTIRKPVTFAEGKLQLQVVFTDTPDPITKVSEHRWSTKIATVTIPKTLARENYVIDPEPIIEQMMVIAAQCVESGNKVSRAEAAAIRAENAADSIQEAVDANTATQAAKAETISAKNTTLAASQIAQLEAEKVQKIVAGNEAYTKAETDQKYATAPTKTAIGTGTIVLDDCDQGSIPVGFMGASEQYQATANKNLFDLEYQKLYGINENRYVNVNGVLTTPTSDKDWKVSYYIKVKPSTVYAFTDLPTSSVTAIAFYTQDKTFISAITNTAVLQNGGTTTTPPNCEYMRVSYRGMVENTLQLEEGGTATAYVQGTVETPSPNYPGKVRSVGDIPKDADGVEIRNLLDEDLVKQYVPTTYNYEKVSGIEFEPGTYKIKIEKIGNSKIIDLLFVKDDISSGVYANVFYKGTVRAEQTLTIPEGSFGYFVVRADSTNTLPLKDFYSGLRTMITSASEIDEYRPYIGDNNACLHVINQDSTGNNVTEDYITLKEPLRGIPDGQGGWLARDVIDTDGNVVQNVIKRHLKDLDGYGVRPNYGINNDTLFSFALKNGTYDLESGLGAYPNQDFISTGALCDYFKIQYGAGEGVYLYGISVANPHYILIVMAYERIKKTKSDTDADIQAAVMEWLDKNDPVIYLALNPDSQFVSLLKYKIALPDFKTTEGRTLIMTPSGVAPFPDIFAEYKQTVKGSAIEAIAEDKNRKIYGVEIAKQANGDIQSSPALTRTDDAVGMTARASTDGNAVVNDFDTAQDWPRLIRCNGYYTDTGQFVVTAYKGEPGYKEDGSNGNVWVQIERFYHEHVETAEKITDRISTKPFPGAILPDIFVGKDGKPLRYAYKGAYEGATIGGKLVSYSGVNPGGHSMNTAIAQARAAGPYCHIGTTSENEIIRLLIQIEFATLNGQAAIGNGVSTLRYTNAASDTATVATTNGNKIIVANAVAALFVVGQYISIGATAYSGSIAESRKVTSIATYDSANKAISFDGAAVNIPVGSFISSRIYYTGNADGVKASSGTMSNDGKHANIYRGFENPFGNCWEVMGDVIFHNGQSTYYKCANPDKWVTNSTLSDDYIPLCYAPSPTEGYAKAFGYDKRFPYSRLTTKIGGSSATYYCDYFYRPLVTTSPDTLREVLLGGYFYYGAVDGPGCWYLNNAVSDSYWNVAGRLSGTGCGGLGEPSPSDQTTDTTE